jgi:DHA2 family multidrug resistance protein
VIDRKWIVAIAVTFGTMMGAIDASIVNVALSQIRASVGATTQEITWISTGFSMATVLVMPLTGFFGRMFGQKRVYLFCLLLFVLGSMLCGISWSLWSLVLFRVLQGFGAGALQPTEQAILRQTFPPEEQGTAMALFTVAVMVGPAFGPTLGGFIVDNFHWSWIFFINVPVGMIGLFMVNRFVIEPEDLLAARRVEGEQQRRNMDWLGIALLWTSLMAIQYVLEEGQAAEWFTSNLIVVMTLIGVFGAAAFVVRELTAPVPAVNLWLFADRTFTTGTLATASVMAVMMSGMFLLPMFMQEFLGFSATQAGLSLMPRTIVMVFCMPLVGRFYNRFPPWLFAGVGLVIAAYAQYTLGTVTLDTGSSQILLAIVLQGAGMSMLLVPMSTIALSRIPRTRLADATGLSSLIRQVGASLGIAAMSSLLTRWSVSSVESLKWQVSPDRPEVAARMAQGIAYGARTGLDPAGADALAVRSLAGPVFKQGMVLAFEHTFIVGAILLLAALPLMLMLRAPPPASAAKPVHLELD